MANLFENDKLKNSTLFQKAIEKGLKVGYLDIETSPHLVWTYSVFKTFISCEQIEEEGKVTSVVILEEGNKKNEIFGWDFSKGIGSDKKLLQKVSKRIETFDLIIMQNGDRLDALILQDRLLKNKLAPLKGLITIDTLKLSRRSFKRPYHNLNYRSQVYGYGGKDKQTMKDCIDVAKGNERKQKTRIKYNVKDVIDMRKVFLRELDYYNLHQSTLNLLRDYIKEEKPYCVKCAARRHSRFKIKEEFISLKNKKRRKRMVCQSCGHHWKIKNNKR